MGQIRSINPFDGALLKEFQEFDHARIDLALSKAETAFVSWKYKSFREKAGLMMNCSAYLKAHKTELGKLMTLEMGKPIRESVAEVEKCAAICDYYAEKAELFLADEMVQSDAS